MEASSTITGTWKVCIIGSLLGCLILLLLNKDYQNLSLSSATSTKSILQFAPLPQPESSLISIVAIPSNKPSNFSNFSPPPLANTLPSSPSSDLSNFSKSSPPPNASIVAEPPNSNDVNLDDLEKSTLNFSTMNPNLSYVNNEIGNPTNKVEKKCNIFDGRWVYKPESNPSYLVSQCPFLEEKMSCQRNGRPDFEYQNWSWEAYDCDIPLLNGTDMVERFRNKRVVLVGDSLNRNMWESLTCILYSSIPDASSKVKINSDGKFARTIFKAKEDYNLTVEFFWSPFLVELNKTHESGKKVLVLDKLSSNSELWAGADILIFNSGHWWPQIGKKKAWEMYEYKGKLTTEMPLHIAYKRAMRTWAKWVENNVNPNKTSLFFRSVSAEHLSKQDDQWCYTKTKPIPDDSYKQIFPKNLIRAIESVIKGMNKSQIKYLNITKLSEYRIDAHPSIYRYKDWKTRAEKDIANLTSTADCGHWCLPGIPDTWNRLLYASLFFDLFAKTSSF